MLVSFTYITCQPQLHVLFDLLLVLVTVVLDQLLVLFLASGNEIGAVVLIPGGSLVSHILWLPSSLEIVLHLGLLLSFGSDPLDFLQIWASFAAELPAVGTSLFLRGSSFVLLNCFEIEEFLVKLWDIFCRSEMNWVASFRVQIVQVRVEISDLEP